MRKISIVLFLISSFFTKTIFAQHASIAYEKEIAEWHSRRLNSLKSEYGWLNLVGLIWLQEGKNSFGSGNNVKAKFPAESISEEAGYFELQNGTVILHANANTDIKVNDKSVKDVVVYNPDSIRQPICSYGSLRWSIIQRDDKIGIRLRDLNSATVKNFKGIERFAVDSNYKVKAYLQKNTIPSSISITNVIGQTNAQKSPGKLLFTLQGKQYALDALEEEGKLFIVFGDATSGKETYAAGRFVYADMPDAKGLTTIDFNKAYNPPCAFTPYATCPLPPKQNILPIAIIAGEKNYKGYDH